MKKPKQPAADTAKKAVTTPAKPSKLEQILVLLGRPEGATLTEMCAATGWQTHSVRGALAGSLKRKGYAVTSDKVDGIRRYRVVPSA